MFCNSICRSKFGKETPEVETEIKPSDAISTLFGVTRKKVIKTIPIRQEMELFGNKTLLPQMISW